MRITSLIVALLTATLFCGGGCKSAKKASSAIGLNRIFQNDRDQLASAHANREIATHMTPEKKSIWERFGGSSKPRVVRRDDPLRLDTKGEVGADIHLSAARLHEQRGDLKSAAASYARALESNKTDEETLLSFARLYDRNDRFEEAEQLYKKALEAHPKSSRVHNDYGLCLVRQGRTPDGLRELGLAVELSPSEPRYRNNIAHVLAGSGRIEDSLEHLRTVHSDAEAHYNVAHWLQTNGNNDAALSHYVRASELDPNLNQAHAMVAQLQETMGAPSGPAVSPYGGQVYNVGMQQGPDRK